MTPDIILKVQILEAVSAAKPGEKDCFLTFHVNTDDGKARLLEQIVDNPRKQYRIMKLDTAVPFASGQWFEEFQP